MAKLKKETYHRLLRQNEKIQKGDEFFHIEDNIWFPVLEHYIGNPHDPTYSLPVRRKFETDRPDIVLDVEYKEPKQRDEINFHDEKEECHALILVKGQISEILFSPSMLSPSKSYVQIKHIETDKYEWISVLALNKIVVEKLK